MKVFVWKSYGHVEVHACETHEQTAELLEQVYEVALQNLYDLDADRAGVLYERYSDTKPHYLINQLLELVGDGADMFEHGTGFTTLKGYKEERTNG